MVGTELRYTYLAKGKYWRFRHPTTGDVKLPGEPGSSVFHERYAELVAQTEAEKPKAAARSTFAWLIARYRDSVEFRALATATQLDYDKTLNILAGMMGEVPFQRTTRSMIKATRDEFAATPRKAHKIRQMISRLYSWADEEELVPHGFNPAAGLKRIKARVKPITPWSEEEIAIVLKAAPAHVRTPIMLALYTGQRREDVVQMTWRDYQGAFIRVRQSKTGEPLDIACHRELRKHLASIKTEFGGPICRTAAGKPFTANALSQALRGVIEKLDQVPNDRSMHGLRYAAAARLEEAGCTIAEATSVLGHRTFQMAMKYLGQRKASAAAMRKQETRA